MIYIYRDAASTSARDLAEEITLQGTRARRTRGQRLRELTPTDHVVCWGSHFAVAGGTKVLNNVPPLNKFAEAQLLKEKGVPTVEVSRNRPNVQAVAPPKPPFVPNWFTVNANNRVGPPVARDLAVRLNAWAIAEDNRKLAWDRLPNPIAVPATTWLPRKNNHVGGADLLDEALLNPDYYSKKEDIIEEYRLHMFAGKSIRAGKKIQRQTRPDGRTAPHAWIRSFDAGWIIQYNDFESTKAMRDVAAAAVKALGLDFGAVDLGKLRNGNFIVLEVNRAPGIENNSTTIYANKIILWSKE